MPAWKIGDVYSSYMPEIALQCKDISEKRWQTGSWEILDVSVAYKN